MNHTLFQLATAYLRRQKKRTALTVLGVMLGCALVCSIGIFLTSVQHMFQTEAEYDTGSHDVAFGSSQQGYFTREQALDLAANHFVTRAGLVVEDESILVRPLEDGQTQGNTIVMAQRDEVALAMKRYKVTEGRLPQNANECMLSSSAVLNWGLDARVGDTVTCDIVRGEEQTPLGARALTWVGTYEDSRNRVVTLPGEGEHHFAVYARLDARDKALAAAEILRDNALDPFNYQLNSGYLRATGMSGDNGFQVALMTTFALLSCIILGAMILVIRNSFAMSTSEKISQFGLMRCVGAAPRQIRSVVYLEALVIWIMALPLGLLLAVLAMAIVFAIVQHVQLSALQYLSLVVAAWPFLLTAGLSLLSVLLSARAPAKRAAAISPIEAVRGNTVFEEPPRSARTKGRLTGLLFGYPGALASKNIRRNRKRFVTTVLSVTVSITLFISLTSFAQAMSHSFDRYGQVGGMDAEVWSWGQGAQEGLDPLYQQLRSDERVEQVAWGRQTYVQMPVEQDKLNPQYPEDLARFPEFERQAGVSSPTPYEGEAAALQGQSVYTGLTVTILVVDRQTYEQLTLLEGSMTYDQLVENHAVALNQHLELRGTGGYRVTQTTRYALGDTLYPDIDVMEEGGGEDAQYKQVACPMTVGAVTQEQPWFVSGLAIFVPVENMDLTAIPEGWVASNGPEEDRKAETYLQNANLRLSLKAAPGQEGSLLSELDGQITAMAAQAEQGQDNRAKWNVGLNNLFEELQEGRNTILVVNIFVYGFMVVVMLICAVNVLNTISTNIQMRKRELCMLRSMGMSQSQLLRMLLVECLLYGAIGTLWGAVLGLGLATLLTAAIHNAFAAALSAPWLYVLLGMAGAIALSLLAGLGPIRRVVRTPAVEGIRAQDG